MNNSTHLAVMAVNAYIINSNDLYELNQKYKRRMWDHLHPYSINHKKYNDAANNNLIPSDYYLQFSCHIEEENPQEFTLFNFNTFDDLLNEEIGAVGVEELFQTEDFEKIMSHFPILTYKDKGKRLGAPFYLLVQMKYFGSYDYESGYTEYELETEIIGYLDGNLDKHIFNPLKLENLEQKAVD